MLGQLARLGDRGVDQLAGLVHRLDEAFFVRFGGVDQTPRIAPVGCGCDAAESGVRVRLLLDDLNTAGDDTDLPALDAHPGIDHRVYNPTRNRTGPPRVSATEH